MRVWEKGQRVRAVRAIVEQDVPIDPMVSPGEPGWVHALVGDTGTVIYVARYHDGAILPTIRFDLTGTATMCLPEEVELLQ